MAAEVPAKAAGAAAGWGGFPADVAGAAAEPESNEAVGAGCDAVGVAVPVGVALGLADDLAELEDGLPDVDGVADLDEGADLVGPGVLAGGCVVGALEVGALLPEFPFCCTVPVMVAGFGRTRMYSASTPRNSAARTRVEVRGRRLVTGSHRSHHRYRARPRR